MEFLWNLGNSNSPQISSTLPNILTDLHKACVWIDKILSFISSFSNLFSKRLGTIANLRIKKSPIILILLKFSHQDWLMVFPSDMSKIKFPYVWGLLSVFWSLKTRSQR